MELVDLLTLLALFLWGAWSLRTIVQEGLWKLPSRERAKIPILWGLLLFSLYIPSSILLLSLYLGLNLPFQFANPFLIGATPLIYFGLSLLPPFRPIWVRNGAESFWKSVKTGAYALALFFPLVMLFEAFLVLIFENFLGYERIDQDAIVYLLSLGNTPLLKILVAVLITTLIPLLEELLFRGFLQNSLRGFLPARIALPVTALIFTLFHFSLEQGFSNFVILPPLFLLALVLSWIYDKAGSLFAPLTLHMLFNTVSVISLLNQP